MKKINIKLNKKQKIIILAIIILLLILITFNPHGIINTVINQIQNEETYSISYEVKGYDPQTEIFDILVIITNPDGIKKVDNIDTRQSIVTNGKKRVGIDYHVEDMTTYNFEITLSNGQVVNETLVLGKRRIGIDTYKKVKELYVNIPNVKDGFNEDYTRYLNVSNEGYLQPGNWISDEEPSNWYDYKNKQWANIYVENKGIESYYVWIPRYIYKIPENNTAGNERVDVKFVDVYNNYIDPETDEKTEWKDLKEQGYKVPEAFETGEYTEISIPGYWMSKYELSELENYTLNYSLTASKKSFNVSLIKTNTEKTIAKYTYALNGKIKHESTILQDYSFNVEPGENENTLINVTALDENGRIIGSMTKKMELVDVNSPDLTGFDKDTTFYVYWDDDEIEHNEIPISEEPPEDWYNYSYSSWANIVTRNNGLESYFVWIPRYQYILDTTTQRVEVKFIEGNSTNVEPGYKIPEAFTFNEKELYGYWISKYELSTDEVTARLNAEIASSDSTIIISDMTGTAVTDNTKYEYYLDGDKKYEGTESNYKYTGLSRETNYVVTIIARNKNTNEFLGAITTKINTEPVNAPQFDGFVENRTYYVLYDDNENMTIGDNITLDGSNMPSNWYDYSNKKWANIVVTDGTVQNGEINGATTTSYFVWIPRYQYLLDTVNERVKIKFIKGNSTATEPGYKIPEAFTFNGKELYGYWISKYELSD